MALGKNIKKQKLIPDKDDAGMQAIEPSASIAEAPNAPEASAHSTVGLSEFQNLSKDAVERRKQLRKKFDDQIAEMRGRRLHMIVFKVGGESYAIDIHKTREVVPTPEITPAPHTPEYILGLAHVRGTFVTVIDMSRKFGRQSDDSCEYTLIVESDTYNVGLLIPEVPSTVVIHGDDVKSGSGVLSDTSLHETYIKGVVYHDAQVIFLLGIDELIVDNSINAIANDIASEAEA